MNQSGPTIAEVFGEDLYPRVPVELEFLKDHLEALKGDLRVILVQLRLETRKNIARDLLQKLGADEDKFAFDAFELPSEGEIACEEIDDLLTNLQEEDVLNFSLGNRIDILRKRIAALLYYSLKMGELGKTAFVEAGDLVREMVSGGRYEDTQLHPDIDLINQWMLKAHNFKGSEQVYKFVTTEMYEAGDEEGGACFLDQKFFELWFQTCTNADEYYDVYCKLRKTREFTDWQDCAIPFYKWRKKGETFLDYQHWVDSSLQEGKFIERRFIWKWFESCECPKHYLAVLEVAKPLDYFYSVPFGSFLEKCKTFGDYKRFYDSVYGDVSVFEPRIGGFASWLQTVETFDELSIWLTYMAKFDLEPNKAMRRFFPERTFGCEENDGLDAGGFSSWLTGFLIDSANAHLAHSQKWDDLYRKLQRICS
jgi:hypothetical protein